jgi:quinolinate synthase
MMTTEEIIERIKQLKKERNAVILAHNYQLPEVQDIADYVGDSLELSRIAAKVKEDVILFAGVDFMAETAKILAPDKTVLVPDKRAICPMAEMIKPDDLEKIKAEHPGVPVMCYVNSSAEIKAMSDVACTSANSIGLAKALDSNEVIFVPDKSLGGYTGAETGKKFILYDGFCPTHHRILAEDVKKTKEAHPKAIVLAHPECTADVRSLADHIASTSGILRLAKELPDKEFIICTEQGLMHRLCKENPDKTFYSPSDLNICPNMKKNNLLKIMESLEKMQYEVIVDDETRKKALNAIEKMVATLGK